MHEYNFILFGIMIFIFIIIIKMIFFSISEEKRKKEQKDQEKGFDNNKYYRDGYDKFGYDRDGYDEVGYDRDGYDRDGYNKNGYDRDGYDEVGYDRDGYDRDGYNKNGYDRDGYDEVGYYNKNFDVHLLHNSDHRTGYDLWGYDRDGYDRDGYDRRGFNRKKIHKDTNTKYNLEGYDKKGYDRDGYNKHGYNKDGVKGKDIYSKRKKSSKIRFDEFGFDQNGYNKEGYNLDGYNRSGYNKDGFNKNGFDRNHIHKATNDRFDIHGFNYLGLHKDTGTEYDPDGFNIDRINKNNFDVNGIHQETNDIWNEKNFNIFHIHKITGTEYDELGFDFDGLHKESNSVWNRKGFSCDGIHKDTKEIYDSQGFDIQGNKVFIKLKLKEKNPNLVPFNIRIQQGSDISKELSHSKMSEIDKLNFKKNEDIEIKLSLPENNPLFEYEAYLDGSYFSEKTINSNKDMYLFLEIKRKQLLFGKKTDDMKVDFSEEQYSENLYLLFDIQDNTTQEEVKKAYYNKMKQFPPNKYPNMFKKIRRAYEILSDSHLRSKYDAARKHGPQIIKLKKLSFQHFEKGEIEKALNTFKSVLELDDTDEDVLMGVLMCYKNQGKNYKVRQIIHSLIELDPLNQDYWIEYGFNELELFMLAKSSSISYKPIEKFFAARDLNPINPMPYLGISQVYFKQKNYYVALFWVDKAIKADRKIDEQDVDLFIMKINILIEKNPNRFEEILEVITSLKNLTENDESFKKFVVAKLMQIVYNVRREHHFTMAIQLLEEIRYLDRDNNDIGMMIAHEKKLSRAYDAYERFMESSVATREFQLILTFLVNANLYTEEESAVFEKTYFQQGLRELEGAPINAIESILYRIRTQYYDLYDYCRDFFSRLERSMQ